MLLRSQSGAVVLFMLLLGSWALAQNDGPQISTTLVTGPRYPAGRWIPLRMSIRNPTPETISGSVSLSMKTDAGPYELQRGVHVPANARVLSDLVASFPMPPAIKKKGEERRPITEILFHGSQGAVVAREPLYATADTESLADAPNGDTPGIVALCVYSTDAGGDIYEPTSLQTVFTEAAGYPVSAASIAPIALMRRGIAYDAARLVVVDQDALEQLDPAQREALMQHVRGGATLLVTGKLPTLSATWIGPLLPLDIVGTREIADIATDAYGTLKFARPAPVLETIARPGTTLVASAPFGPVAAYRAVGFGRVAMVSVPVNAVVNTEPQLSRMWGSLIGFSRPTFHEPQQFAGASSDDPTPAAGAAAPAGTPGVDRSVYGVLRAMVGQTAPPWRTAAIVAGVYTVSVAGVMLLVGAKRRPAALLACVAGGVVLAGGVLGISQVNAGNDQMLVARYSTVDLSGGAARRNEYVAFFGQRDAKISFSLPDLALPRALVAAGKTAPRVKMFPFTVDRVSASTGNLASVWQVRSLDTNAPKLDATLAFDESGAKLSVDSGLSVPLETSRLVYGPNVFPVPEIQSGATSNAVGRVNPKGVWAGGDAIIADEQSKLRMDILSRSETPIASAGSLLVTRTPEMRLVGFADSEDSAVKLNEEVLRKTQTLVRTPVSIVPTPVGASVTIAPGFTQIRREGALSLPYADATGEWNESGQGGPWLVGIAAPQGVGRIDVKQLTLDLDVRSVGHDVTIRREQVRGGKVRENAQGEIVLQSKSSGRQQATSEINADDMDANGWVWLLVEVRPPEASESMLGGIADPGQQVWRFLRFDAGLRGVVVAPPQPVIQTWQANENRDVRPAPKPDPKADAPKKTEPKKTDKKPDPKKPDAKKPDAKTEPKPKDTKKP